MSGESCFEQLIARCGIAEVFAARAIRGALAQAGVNVDDLDPKTLRTAMPEVEAVIRLYLGPDAEEHIQLIRALAEG